MRRLAACLVALFSLGAIAPHAARADEKKQVYVEPSKLAAAKEANRKAGEARQLIKDGKRPEGAKLLDEALGELERTMGPDSGFAQANRKLLLLIYKALNQPEKGAAVEKRAENARKTWKEPTSPASSGPPPAAMQKLQAGLLALKANDFTRAAELLEQASPDVEKSESEQSYLLVSGILASLYDYSQQFSKGETLRKNVIARMERKLGADDPEVGEQYASLATHYMMSAETAKAVAAQKRCVEIARKSGPGSALLADRLLTLGDLQMDTAENKAGQAALGEALTIVRGLNPPDPLRMVRAAHAIVRVRDADLDFAEGDKAADLVCSLATQLPRPDVLEEAETDCIRAAIAKGDTKGAGVLAGARFSRIEKRYGGAGPFFIQAAHELAMVRWAEGRKDESTALARRAAEAQEKHLVRLLNASGEAQKREQIHLISSQSYDLLSMGGAGDGGGPAQVRLAFESILRCKGRSLDAAADAARVVRLFDKPADKTLARRQVEVRRQIAGLGLRGATGGAAPPGIDPAALLAKLEAEDDDLGNKLAAASPVYRAQERPVTIEAVQATIPDDSALVEYVFYVRRDTTSARFAPNGIRFVAFVLHKTGEPVAVDLGDAVVVDGAVAQLRTSLSERGDVLSNAKRVHDLVVAPLRRYLQPNDKRLIVSPDEDLNLVPFAALVGDRGRFLIQDYEISYVTSGRDLLRIAAVSAQRSPSGKAVVIGDPAFDGPGASAGGSSTLGADRGTRGDLDNVRFPPLPGTAVEAKAIAGLLAASSYSQSEATKAQLAGVKGPVVLHVATHGFFLTKQKDPAGDHARGLEYDPGSPAIAPPRTDNPLVRSGLALAGANKKGSADGLLTALEASSMSLDGTKLVVLSACETGVGQSEVGDGVYGLRRALVVAGSETQLMSLWKVDDEATRDLMIAYYKDLRAGSGRAASLRTVQLAMLAKKETQHPYYWAAFIPSGAWGAMTFDVQAPAASNSGSTSETRPAEADRPAPSPAPERRNEATGSAAVGFHYVSLHSLGGQPDHVGAMAGLTIEHEAIADYVGHGDGFGVHDAFSFAVYLGGRTSDAVKYPDDGEESGLVGGFRTGYELTFGVSEPSYGVFAGAQAMYTAFVIGDARTYGLTLPLVAAIDFRIGSMFLGLRGTYGRFLVDQETMGASAQLDTSWAFLLAGVERMKMTSSVSLDGQDDQAATGHQSSTFGTIAVGGRF